MSTVSNSKTTSLSIRLPESAKKRLQSFAKSSHKSTSAIAQEAIQNYIDLRDWQIEGVKKAINQMDKGQGINGDIMLEWMSSLGHNDELPRPSNP